MIYPDQVGTEWVIKGQTCEQSTNATAGIARAIYDRLFKWLIEVRDKTTLISFGLNQSNTLLLRNATILSSTAH